MASWTTANASTILPSGSLRNRLARVANRARLVEARPRREKREFLVDVVVVVVVVVVPALLAPFALAGPCPTLL
jgi:hypothetical protein